MALLQFQLAQQLHLLQVSYRWVRFAGLAIQVLCQQNIALLPAVNSAETKEERFGALFLVIVIGVRVTLIQQKRDAMNNLGQSPIDSATQAMESVFEGRAAAMVA